MRRLRFLIPPAATALAALALAGGAQAAGDLAMQAQDCQLDSEDGDAVLPDETPLNPADDPTLSETLDPCNGVLAPDPVGDDAMTIAPPEGGETPVITPDELPPQPPQEE